MALPPAPATLTLVFGTGSMQDYVFNWLSHASRIPALRPYAAIAIDDELYRVCRHWQEPVLSASELLQEDGQALNATSSLRMMLAGKGSVRNEKEVFKLLGFVKARLTLGLLRRGYHVLLSDADSVWLGDPWPWIGAGGPMGEPSLPAAADAGLLPSADVLTTNDYPDLRRDGQPDSVFNTGALFFRSTPRAIAIVAEWWVPPSPPFT